MLQLQNLATALLLSAALPASAEINAKEPIDTPQPLDLEIPSLGLGTWLSERGKVRTWH